MKYILVIYINYDHYNPYIWLKHGYNILQYNIYTQYVSTYSIYLRYLRRSPMVEYTDSPGLAVHQSIDAIIKTVSFFCAALLTYRNLTDMSNVVAILLGKSWKTSKPWICDF